MILVPILILQMGDIFTFELVKTLLHYNHKCYVFVTSRLNKVMFLGIIVLEN